MPFWTGSVSAAGPAASRRSNRAGSWRYTHTEMAAERPKNTAQNAQPCQYRSVPAGKKRHRAITTARLANPAMDLRLRVV